MLAPLYKESNCKYHYPFHNDVLLGTLSVDMVCLDYGRDHPRFFDQVGHQTTNASISLNNDVVRLTKIMNNLVKYLKILSF